MYKTLGKAISCLALFWAGAAQAAAVDSYHYLHVTIETPWVIFLILLPMVLAPLLLMAVMAWRYAERRKDNEQPEGASAEAKE